MCKQSLFIVLALFSGTICAGQRVQWKAFRLTEENEFFNATQHGIDRYYTQGVKFEFCYQVAERKFLEKLMMPASSSATNTYSIAVSQQIFTPKRTRSYFFVGDMPYSGALYFSQALESTDSLKQMRLSTRLDMGIIGPGAMARNTQLLFHQIIQNSLAVGWITQMRHDVYLNYQLKAEKAITKPRGFFRVEGKGEVNVGSVLISAVPGINFELGTWYQPLRKNKSKVSWQIFVRPELRVILFNAMLQGGVLNQFYAEEFYAQYFISKIKPLVYAHSMGLRLRYKEKELFYRQVNQTREFSGQRPHYFSTLMFTFPIRSKQSGSSK